MDQGLAPLWLLPGNPSGRSLSGRVQADGLDAAARPAGRLTFGGQAGEDGGRRAAAPQQASQRQRHSRPGHLGVRRSWGRGPGPVPGPVPGLRSPLRGGRAVQGHADGGRTNRSAGQEGGTGGGAGGVGGPGVDGEVGDGGGEAAQLWGQRGHVQVTGANVGGDKSLRTRLGSIQKLKVQFKNM